MGPFHRLKSALVLPVVQFRMSVGVRQDTAATVPTGRKIYEQFQVVVPSDNILASVDVVFMDVHEHAHLRSWTSCNIISLQKDSYFGLQRCSQVTAHVAIHGVTADTGIGDAARKCRERF